MGEERWNIDTCCKDASSMKLVRLAGNQLVRTIDALLQVCTVLVSRLINYPATHSKLGTYPAIMGKMLRGSCAPDDLCSGSAAIQRPQYKGMEQNLMAHIVPCLL